MEGGREDVCVGSRGCVCKGTRDIGGYNRRGGVLRGLESWRMAQLTKESVRFMDWRYEILFEAGLCTWPELFVFVLFFFYCMRF